MRSAGSSWRGRVSDAPPNLNRVLLVRRLQRIAMVVAFAALTFPVAHFLQPVFATLKLGAADLLVDRSLGRHLAGRDDLAGLVMAMGVVLRDACVEICQRPYLRAGRVPLQWPEHAALACTALSTMVMAPVIGRWKDPAPWRALRATCIGLGLLWALTLCCIACIGWDLACWLSAHRSGMRAYLRGFRPEWMLVGAATLLPACIWRIRRLDETNDLMGLDRLVRNSALAMTAVSMLSLAFDLSVRHWIRQVAGDIFLGEAIFVPTAIMASLLWLDTGVLAMNRRSRRKRMDITRTLCPNCGYPRVESGTACPECGVVPPPAMRGD
jgi:hypothetical protein